MQHLWYKIHTNIHRGCCIDTKLMYTGTQNRGMCDCGVFRCPLYRSSALQKQTAAWWGRLRSGLQKLPKTTRSSHTEREWVFVQLWLLFPDSLDLGRPYKINVYLPLSMFLCQALQTLESRLKLLSGDTCLSVEQKIAEVQDSVRKAKVLDSP